jgi:cobalt-zinc-cadmium efflux system protein
MQPHDSPGVQERFLLALGLTVAVLIVEVIGGLWTHSLALLSDSAHVFMDIFALGLSYLALRLSAMPADDRHTYGYHRLEVLAALANGATLVLIAIGIFWEAFVRWRSPEPVRSVEMLWIAAAGLAVNVVVALVLRDRPHVHDGGPAHVHDQDLNMRSAFLHVIGDAISSVGVIAAAVVISFTGYMWVDPLVSLLIGGIILTGSYRVVRESLHILVEGVPSGLRLNAISQAMETVPGVGDVHDLHIWNICSRHIALSAHVLLAPDHLDQSSQVLSDLRGCLNNFGIQHSTIQVESVACSEQAGQQNAVCD